MASARKGKGMNPRSPDSHKTKVSDEPTRPTLLGDESADAGGSNDALSRAPLSLRKTAHDLRNALNVMRNAAYLLRRKLVAAGGEHVDLVDMIEESVKSAETIATQIMDQAERSGESPASRNAPRSKGLTGQSSG